MTSRRPESDDACPIPNAMATKAPEGEGWFGAGRWVAEHFFQNFWYIVVRTVPLMFVAGLLGTAVIVTLPFDALGDMFPVGNKMLVLMSMAFVALVGILLPVPIAFDVVIVAILLTGGLAPRYAMVLLFTLGIFSIYSFFVVWQGMSKKIAVMMMIGAAGVGVVAGVAADQLYKRDLEHRSAVFYETFGETANTRGPTTYTVDTGEHREAMLGDPLPREAWESSTAEVAIERILNASPSPFAEPRFTRIEGKDIGFNEAHSFSAMYYLTFSRFRAVASGDVHNDGYPDVLLATENGVVLYANEGGKQFAKQTIHVPNMEEYYTVNSAFVDMNNDGWLDIVFAAYGDGVFVIQNDHGNFAAENMQLIPNRETALMPGAMSFGDIDEDGDLDVFFGNWSVGSMGQNPRERGTVEMSKNALVINHGDHFEVKSIEGWTGETLSSIFSDINMDGHLDLIVANDFDPNDDYYFGDGTGNFRRIFREDDIIEHTGFSTMSIASADIDNDLSPEIYVAQITAREGNSPIELVPASNQVCEEMQDPQYMDHCQTVMAFHQHMADGLKSINLDKALQVDPEMREDAIAVMLFHTAVKWNRNPAMIDLFGEKWDRFATAARATFSPREAPPTPEEKSTGLKNPTALENILLTRTEDGRFVDVASKFNLLQGGWTWNAKFADLTNDGYQDIYMVNGEITSGMRERKFFYENIGGERFEEKTKEYGFGSLLATSAYTYIDMDNDGDLDIVSAPAIGPLLIYRNNLNEGNSIGFELRDNQGNRFGIGSKITIRYEGGQQMRELQAGGGFVSFDAPIAHFGLGAVDEVASVEIDWSRGGRTVVEGPFPSGARYIVKRVGEEDPSSEREVSAGL